MTRKILIALPPAMLEQVDKIALVEHRTRSDLMREMARRYISDFVSKTDIDKIVLPRKPENPAWFGVAKTKVASSKSPRGTAKDNVWQDDGTEPKPLTAAQVSKGLGISTSKTGVGLPSIESADARAFYAQQASERREF